MLLNKWKTTINIWAACIGIGEPDEIDGLGKGIAEEYTDNNGKVKNKQKAFEINLKFIKPQKHVKNNK